MGIVDVLRALARLRALRPSQPSARMREMAASMMASRPIRDFPGITGVII
jgi:hypothetical protein